MATFWDHLTDDVQRFVEAQHVFFVATAAAEGRINLSPKGMDTFRVLDDRTVAYLDLTGSGNETAAHLTADGRITLMLCSFDRAPDIIRLYGRGRVVALGTPEWEALIPRFTMLPGARQLMVVDVDSVQSSCGYAVPLMEHVTDRDTLRRYLARKDDDGELRGYWDDRNAASIDGLSTPPIAPGAPGTDRAPDRAPSA